MSTERPQATAERAETISGDDVTARERDLYDLLQTVLADVRVPDTLPGDLAVSCDDLVDVRETVMDYDRGSVDLNSGAYGMSYCHRVRDAVDACRNRDPLRLVAVGCSASKQDEAAPARNLYRGAYWTCKRQYAEAVGDDWRVVSAAHAVLDPDRETDPYERTPDDLRGIPADATGRLPSGDPVDTFLDQWALRVYEGLDAWMRAVAGGVDPRDVHLEVLLGRGYHDPLAERGVFDALRHTGDLTVSFPFREHDFAGNGEQMAWLNDQVEAVQ